jgi:hypothetical protein
MCRRSASVLATVLAYASSATAAPAMPFIPDLGIEAIERPVQSNEGGFILEARGRGGGGRTAGRRAAASTAMTFIGTYRTRATETRLRTEM